MNLRLKMAVHFTLTAITYCYIILKNLLFSLRQYHSTHSLLDNPDTDSYQNIPSNSPQSESVTLSNLLTHTPLLKLLHSPIQNPTSTTFLNHNLDETFNSTDTEFEKLQNPIYHSKFFLQFYPRVADSPKLSFESSSNSQTLPTQIRAPHSP